MAYTTRGGRGAARGGYRGGRGAAHGGYRGGKGASGDKKNFTDTEKTKLIYAADVNNDHLLYRNTFNATIDVPSATLYYIKFFFIKPNQQKELVEYAPLLKKAFDMWRQNNIKYEPLCFDGMNLLCSPHDITELDQTIQSNRLQVILQKIKTSGYKEAQLQLIQLHVSRYMEEIGYVELKPSVYFKPINVQNDSTKNVPLDNRNLCDCVSVTATCIENNKVHFIASKKAEFLIKERNLMDYILNMARIILNQNQLKYSECIKMIENNEKSLRSKISSFLNFKITCSHTGRVIKIKGLHEKNATQQVFERGGYNITVSEYMKERYGCDVVNDLLVIQAGKDKTYFPVSLCNIGNIEVPKTTIEFLDLKSSKSGPSLTAYRMRKLRYSPKTHQEIISNMRTEWMKIPADKLKWAGIKQIDAIPQPLQCDTLLENRVYYKNHKGQKSMVDASRGVINMKNTDEFNHIPTKQYVHIVNLTGIQSNVKVMEKILNSTVSEKALTYTFTDQCCNLNNILNNKEQFEKKNFVIFIGKTLSAAEWSSLKTNCKRPNLYLVQDKLNELQNNKKYKMNIAAKVNENVGGKNHLSDCINLNNTISIAIFDSVHQNLTAIVRVMRCVVNFNTTDEKIFKRVFGVCFGNDTKDQTLTKLLQLSEENLKLLLKEAKGSISQNVKKVIIQQSACTYGKTNMKREFDAIKMAFNDAQLKRLSLLYLNFFSARDRFFFTKGSDVMNVGPGIIVNTNDEWSFKFIPHANIIPDSTTRPLSVSTKKEFIEWDIKTKKDLACIVWALCSNFQRSYTTINEPSEIRLCKHIINEIIPEVQSRLKGQHAAEAELNIRHLNTQLMKTALKT